MTYTFNTLLSQLTEGISDSFKLINISCLNIAFIKAIQKGLCEIGKDKVLSKEALDFILDYYGQELQKLHK